MLLVCIKCVSDVGLLLLIILQKDVLKHALSRLPAPRNDYEIVVPDSESHVDSSAVNEDFIPDQSDVEAHRDAELRAKSECINFTFVNRSFHDDVIL